MMIGNVMSRCGRPAGADVTLSRDTQGFTLGYSRVLPPGAEESGIRKEPSNNLVVNMSLTTKRFRIFTPVSRLLQ